MSYWSASGIERAAIEVARDRAWIECGEDTAAYVHWHVENPNAMASLTDPAVLEKIKAHPERYAD